jgi:cell division protein FtsI/penicillin-binding protein 2
MAAALQVVAGNGDYYPPIIVEGLQGVDGKGKPLAIGGPLQPGLPVLAGSTVATLQDKLAGVARSSTDQPAQIRQRAAGLGGTVWSGQAPDDNQSCSWFGGYAPVQAPRFVGVVLLEDVPNGAAATATLFAKIMSECLNEENSGF